MPHVKPRLGRREVAQVVVVGLLLSSLTVVVAMHLYINGDSVVSRWGPLHGQRTFTVSFVLLLILLADLLAIGSVFTWWRRRSSS
mgnify:FL=1